MTERTVEIGSRLRAPEALVWRSATSVEGINQELLPLLRMTFPRALRGLSLEHAPVGRRLCRSWLLLFGVLPVGYDDVTLQEVAPGRFVEDSDVLALRRWRHERTLRAQPDGGCVVTDRLTYEPRLPFLSPAVGVVVRALFTHRHRRLRRRFGGREDQRRAL